MQFLLFGSSAPLFYQYDPHIPVPDVSINKSRVYIRCLYLVKVRAFLSLFHNMLINFYVCGFQRCAQPQVHFTVGSIKEDFFS
jgi:hypothetical protein